MITFKHKDIEIQFTPLEDGKCQYLVSVHDFGNLESVVNRVLSYTQLTDLINSPESCINFLRYL